MTAYKQIIGRFGESLAKEFLSRRGYKPLAANLKFGKLEIDLIMEHGGQTVFIEVKTRKAASAGPAEDALKSSQIKDLKRAIAAYCRCHKLNPNKIRLDFVAIKLDAKKQTAKIQHFKDIF